MISSSKIKNPQMGVSLIEILGSMAVISLISVSLLMWVNRQQDSSRSQLLGLQLSAWKVYVQEHILDHARSSSNPFGITGASPSKAFLLPLSGYSPDLLMSGTNQSRFLSWMQQRDQQGIAINADNQRYCLFLKQKPSAILGGDAEIDGILLTVGGKALTDAETAEALMVMGPRGGRIGSSVDCAPLSAGCFTNGLGANHQGWRYPVTQDDFSVINQACGSNLSPGHLSYILDDKVNTRIIGDPLYRISFGTSNETPDQTIAFKSLNTMRHDLQVRGDITSGLISKVSGTSCVINSDSIARDNDGSVLQCNNGLWGKPVINSPDIPGVPNFVGVNKIVTKSIGLDGVGYIQLQNTSTALSNIGQTCKRTGDFRRDESGGVVGCQIPEGESMPKWDRMGASVIRWKMFPVPISIPFGNTLTSRVDLQKNINFKSYMSNQVNNLDKMRMALIKIKTTPRQIKNQLWQTRQGKVCMSGFNFYFGISQITESDLVVDVNQSCLIDLADLFDGTPGAQVEIQVLGYLCEGNLGCS